MLNKADECNYIEVGGGPGNLPKKYHTVIELPAGWQTCILTGSLSKLTSAIKNMDVVVFYVFETVQWLKFIFFWCFLGSRKRGVTKRSPLGWRSFFSKARHSSQGSLTKNRKASTPGIVIAVSACCNVLIARKTCLLTFPKQTGKLSDVFC